MTTQSAATAASSRVGDVLGLGFGQAANHVAGASVRSQRGDDRVFVDARHHDQRFDAGLPQHLVADPATPTQGRAGSSRACGSVAQGESLPAEDRVAQFVDGQSPPGALRLTRSPPPPQAPPSTAISAASSSSVGLPLSTWMCGSCGLRARRRLLVVVRTARRVTAECSRASSAAPGRSCAPAAAARSRCSRGCATAGSPRRRSLARRRCTG